MTDSSFVMISSYLAEGPLDRNSGHRLRSFGQVRRPMLHSALTGKLDNADSLLGEGHSEPLAALGQSHSECT